MWMIPSPSLQPPSAAIEAENEQFIPGVPVVVPYTWLPASSLNANKEPVVSDVVIKEQQQSPGFTPPGGSDDGVKNDHVHLADLKGGIVVM